MLTAKGFQVAHRYYESILFDIAKSQVKRRIERKFKSIGRSERGPVDLAFEGKYNLKIYGIDKYGVPTGRSCEWVNQKQKRSKCDIHNDFVHTLAKHAKSKGWSDMGSM